MYRHGKRFVPGIYTGVMLLGLCLIAGGCTRMAVRGSSGLVPHMTRALFAECDPVLARESIPANLKMMEGLLRADPENGRLLSALSMGYTGYAMLFVEDENTARASRLLHRALEYGFDALDPQGRSLRRSALNPEEVSRILHSLGPNDVEALFWCGLAWTGWIRLNLDRPEALAQLDAAKSCLRRVIDLDGSCFYGLPYAALAGTLSAVPPMLGGRPEEALGLFEKAIAEHHGRFLLAKVYFARYYAVRIQDRELFIRLIDEVEAADPEALEDACLLNAAAHLKARRLRQQMDDLFF